MNEFTTTPGSTFDTAVRALFRQWGYPVDDTTPIEVEARDGSVYCGEGTCDFDAQIIEIWCGNYCLSYGDDYSAMYDERGDDRELETFNGFGQLMRYLEAVDLTIEKGAAKVAMDAGVPPTTAVVAYAQDPVQAVAGWRMLAGLLR